jgi:uncharacterized protein (DUF433 family)
VPVGVLAYGPKGAVVDLMTRHENNIDWSECPLVESKQGVHSGDPVLRGTRMPVSAIVDNFEYGVSVSEISEQFEIPEDCIKALVSYAQSHRVAHSV